MKEHKLIKLLAKLEKQYEQVPESQSLKRDRIMRKYESIYKKYTNTYGDIKIGERS